MKTVRLRSAYIAVMKERQLSYGGNQSWAAQKTIRKYGCGVIAGTDLLFYLHIHKEYCHGREFLSAQGVQDFYGYMELVRTMKRKYFPLIPGFGISGWFLCLGVNRYFIRNRIPLKASFGISGKNIWNKTRTMLVHDIPVLLAIGPNFPIPLKKHKLALYKKKGREFVEACKVCAHYVIVTGVEGEWLKISTWGEAYYINIQEYDTYVNRYSSSFVSNVLYIKKK